MATGFGCFVVGPAGSGKVLLFIHSYFIVNFMPRHIRSRGDGQEDLQSLQPGPSSRNLQVQMWYWHPWSYFSGWCVIWDELRSQWWAGLLHGVPDRQPGLADERALRVCRGVLRPVWLPRVSGALLPSGRDDSPYQGNPEEWVLLVRHLLLWWDLRERAIQVHRGMPDLPLSHDLTQHPTPEHPH